MLFQEIELGSPVAAAERLRASPGFVWLDSAMRHESLGRYSYMASDPFGVFSVRDGAAFWNDVEEADAPIGALRLRLAQYREESHPDLPPFQGGAVGYLGYEMGAVFDRAPDPAGAEQMRLGFYDVVLAWDHKTGRSWLISTGWPEKSATGREARAAARMAEMLAKLQAERGAGTAAFPLRLDWRSNFTLESYSAAVEQVKSLILDGDIYQANIAQRFTAELPGAFDCWALYKRLRETNPATFAAFLDFGDLTVASSSPERFLRCREGRVETRPIKGTAPRSDDPAADLAAGEALLRSEKDRAENVMIVDLLRNDLSRVCKQGSVQVPTLCGLESYASVHHLVSVVLGRLKDDADALDLVAASFPGGSITGAPKIRAMEIIREIEDGPRGPYCGAIGYFGFDGAMDLNIVIRTVVFEGREATLWVGGGITMLSDPAAEYVETLDKAQRVFAAFDQEGA